MDDPAADRTSLGELARLFLRLGLTAFGGPAAHVAMLEEEVVTRRRWLSPQHFLDLLGATNLIPGPNSTEMVMHVGFERAGFRGLVVAGSAFILPAALITAAFAWAYVRFGSLPAVQPWLYGLPPVVLAIILAAVWRLGPKAVKGWPLAILGVLAVVATLLGVPEIAVLLGGGLLGALVLGGMRPATGAAGVVFIPQGTGLAAAGAGAAAAGVSLSQLGWIFLKVGAVLYGSGYVLVALLEAELVEARGWLTQTQLLDAIAAGQLTPGPVLSTATFIGYVLAGSPGAAVATLAIFLPSFVFVALLNPIVPRLRRSRWSAAFLDAVGVCALALMAAVVLELGMTTLDTWPRQLLAVLAAVAALGLRVGAPWLVLGGSALGFLLTAL